MQNEDHALREAQKIEIANEAVGLNLDRYLKPKHGVAQGYACARSAVDLTIAALSATPTPEIAGAHKYRKTALIEATQWLNMGDHPAVKMHPHDPHTACGWIDTLEGGHIVTPGDWIATGVKGEHWPIKPDIFAATYESATPTPAPIDNEALVEEVARAISSARDNFAMTLPMPVTDYDRDIARAVLALPSIAPRFANAEKPEEITPNASNSGGNDTDSASKEITPSALVEEAIGALEPFERANRALGNDEGPYRLQTDKGYREIDRAAFRNAAYVYAKLKEGRVS